MPENHRPIGKRFSHVYPDRGAPADDSKRMRRCVGSQIYEFKVLQEQLAEEVRREHGIFVPYPTYWPDFLEDAETAPLHDVLDLITTAFQLLKKLHMETQSKAWLVAVQRIFQEENVHYRVDAEGGVHFYPDADYARTRAAAIAALQSIRYANALDAYEKGTAALAEVLPNGKGAIREVFAAVEAIFCLLLPNMPRLGADECEKLGPLIQRQYSERPLRAAMKMLSSFKDWVDAAQFYRHEEGKADEVSQPLAPARRLAACAGWPGCRSQMRRNG